MKNFCVNTKNYEGKRVIFTQAQREKKWSKHPELRDDEFIKRVQGAIENPSFIYDDLAVKGRLVYYRYEYSTNGRAVYAKVVLNSGKTKLLYGQDNY